MADRYNLISMSVRNFRGIEHADLDFTRSKTPRDIMTFYGHQGSGKSTLILAIQWCAYGTDLSLDKNKLYYKRLLPNHWDGDQKDSVSVLMRFRPFGEGFDPADDIFCKRVFDPNKSNRDHLEVTIGNESFDQYESQDYFSQIFGNSPNVEEGVMWVIRREEMLRMADTISPDKNSYFLDFMNLRVPYTGLTELNQKYQDSIDDLLDKTPKKSFMDSRGLQTEITRLEALLLQKEEEFTKEAIRLRESKPSSRDELLSDAREVFEQAEKENGIAENELNKLKIRNSEIPELINALLYSKIKQNGLEIERSFASSEFDWKRIAAFLETTNRIPPNIVDLIRKLSTESGYNTASLIKAGETVSDWLERIQNLKMAKQRHINALGEIRRLEASGITKESTKDAHQKVESAKLLNQKCKSLNVDIDYFKTKLKGLRRELTNLEKKIAKKSANENQIKSLTRKKTAVNGLMRVITETNNTYTREMFEQTIERVKYYWKEIDQIGKYAPIMIDSPTPQFALENLESGAIQTIQINGENGDAAGGETQLLLVCTCLAVSESSGAKMPIILDDCFTDVDKKTRKQLVKTVAKHFGSLIFVTNDPDKANLLESSEGRLVLNWPKEWLTINQGNSNEWGNWE